MQTAVVRRILIRAENRATAVATIYVVVVVHVVTTGEKWEEEEEEEEEEDLFRHDLLQDEEE